MTPTPNRHVSTVRIFTDEEREALEDGISALRYRAERLRDVAAQGIVRAVINKFERDAEILDKLVKHG